MTGKQALRRTQVVLRHVGPWSVLKFSLLFYFCVMLIIFFASVILFTILKAAGAIEPLETILGNIFSEDPSTKGPAPIRINSGQLFTAMFVGGIVLTVVWSLVTTFVVFVYNLVSDIVGGVEMTLAEKRR